MGGKLIVIEGLDGSGKATQTKLLYDALEKQTPNVRMLSFPCYEDDSSVLVKMYLAGEFGQRPDDVNGYAASTFFAVDRYASYKKSWEKDYKDGFVFLADRYTTSNAVYQAGKLPREEWDEYLDWLYDFEYNLLGIPKPDIVIYLDLPPEISRELMTKRYTGDETKKDIHEKDTGFQTKSREAALYCAAKQNWHIINCESRGGIREEEDIAREILVIIEDKVLSI